MIGKMFHVGLLLRVGIACRRWTWNLPSPHPLDRILYETLACITSTNNGLCVYHLLIEQLGVTGMLGIIVYEQWPDTRYKLHVY